MNHTLGLTSQGSSIVLCHLVLAAVVSAAHANSDPSNNDPAETTNVAAKPRYSKRLEEMKRLLKQELLKFPNRPFGEFIPGGNAVGIEGQTGLVQTLRKFAAAKK